MTVEIITGDCLNTLRTLPAESVHCCITSPPYFGLRDYGLPPTHWPAVEFSPMPGLPVIAVPAQACCLGLESDPWAFIGHIVAVFREVRRVLRADGTLWVNFGDSYANDGKWGGSSGGKHARALHGDTGIGRTKAQTGLKPKDMMGIPWRVAFALQADGWYLRQDIIWAKPNPMPESVTDRCTKAHEYLFLLSKSPRYYFDAEAMREPAVAQTPAGNGFAGRQGGAAHMPMSGGAGSSEPWRPRSKRDTFKREGSKRAQAIPGQSVGTHRPDRAESEFDTETRNRRSVWTVATRPFKGAHFATFPPALIEPCVLAGCPKGGKVLDTFAGAGTTGLVCQRNGRDAVLLEIKPEYSAMADARIRAERPHPDLFEATP
jgi:DNA modification methylase